MKIAYVISVSCSASGVCNGIVQQAASWADGLRKRGHEIVMIDPWGGSYDWSSFDIIQFFGISEDLKYLSQMLRRETNIPCVFSPIIDTERWWFFSHLSARSGISLLHLSSPWSNLWEVASYGAYFLARSDYEKNYIRRALKVSDRKIYKVPLNFRELPAVDRPETRRRCCLHVSTLAAPRKNVKRLIRAAVENGFELLLAGSIGNPEFGRYLEKVTAENSNICYLGKVSDEELAALYSRVTCFALPSLFEGVGLVALEAAAHGCDIVMTDRGAPKEYYAGLAHLVNPSSTSEIGRAVAAVLAGETHQPELEKRIKEHYSLARIAEVLEGAYADIVGV